MTKFITSQGIKLRDRPGLFNRRQRNILRSDTYERKEARLSLAITRPGDNVLELGGGLGFISSLIAKNAAPNHITVVEANPKMCAYIRQTHQDNDVANATVVNAIADNSDDNDIPFYIRKHFVSSTAVASPEIVEDADTERRLVPQRGLEGLLEQSEADVLICDIEGSEATLFSGVDLGSLRAALIELHPKKIGKKGEEKIFKTLQSAGLLYDPALSENRVVVFRRKER